MAYKYESYSNKRMAWEDKLPSQSLIVSEQHLLDAFHVLNDRQEAWKNRFILKKPRPWSKDELLENNKYLWHYRELDNHSQWEIRNIHLQPVIEGKTDFSNRKERIWKTMLFRIFNQPKFFEYIEKRTEGKWKKGLPDCNQFNAEELFEYASDYRASGNNPFTNAYLINSKLCLDKKRDWCYCLKVVPYIHKNLIRLISVIDSSKNPEEIIKFLISYPAISDFVAHEIYVSFTFGNKFGKFPFMKWTQDDFTNVGPGCSLGLRLVFPSFPANKQIEGIYWLKDIAKDFLHVWYPDFDFLHFSKDEGKFYLSKEFNLSLLTFENLMCEYQKYWKTKIGMGRQRARYQMRTQNTYFDELL